MKKQKLSLKTIEVCSYTTSLKKQAQRLQGGTNIAPLLPAINVSIAICSDLFCPKDDPPKEEPAPEQPVKPASPKGISVGNTIVDDLNGLIR